MTWIRFAIVGLLAAGCAVSDTGVTTPPPTVVSPPASPPQLINNAGCPANIDIVGQMQTSVSCESFCLPEEQPRSSLQRVFWIDDRRGKQGTSRVDVSIYENGFDQAAYMSLCPVTVTKKSGKPNRAAMPQLSAMQAEPSMQVEVLESHIARKRGEAHEVVVKDLQPGVAYFWRAVQETDSGWVASPVQYCMATVCPVDYVDDDPRIKPEPTDKDDEKSPNQQYGGARR